MHNQILRGLIFIILVFLVTSDLKEIFSTIAASSTFGGAFIQRQQGGKGQSSSSSHGQRSKRHVASPSSSSQNRFSEADSIHPADREEEDDDEEGDDGGPRLPSSMKLRPFTSREGDGEEHPGEGGSSSADDDNDEDSLALDPVKRLTSRGKNLYAKRKIMKLNEEERKELLAMKTQLTQVMQEWCLPKLVCELHASVSDRGSLTEAEKGLLSLIRETSLGTMGEVVSRYHFAAHMGQLLSGVEGNGCHNFYPNCPLSGSRVLQMMKKVRIR